MAVASENNFLPPYSINLHASSTSGLAWDEFIRYSSLVQTLTEATANLVHLYSKGDVKCKNLSTIIGLSFRNLDLFECPDRSEFRMAQVCSLLCHKYRDKSYTLRNASNLYGWLMHYIPDNGYIKCPKDDTRHTAILIREWKLIGVICFSVIKHWEAALLFISLPNHDNDKMSHRGHDDPAQK
jgi:hypothetical protein